MKYIFSILALSFLFTTGLNAQKATTPADTSSTDDDALTLGFEQSIDFSHPTIQLSYGAGTINWKKLADDFDVAPQMILNARIGFTNLDPKKFKSGEVEHIRFNFLDLNSGSIADKDDPAAQVGNFSFGFGKSEGYGYTLFGDAKIFLNHNRGSNFTFFDYPNRENFGEGQDNFPFDRYGTAMRYGTYNGAEVRLKLLDNLSIDASYQRELYYTRVLFLKMLTSDLLEFIANGVADVFVTSVFNSSPEFGPIVYFVLRNALGYGIYELRRNNQFAPFNSDQPMLIDSWRVGATFYF